MNERSAVDLEEQAPEKDFRGVAWPRDAGARARGAGEDIVITGDDGTQVLKGVTGHLDQVLSLAAFLADDSGRFHLSFKSILTAFLAVENELTAALFPPELRQELLRKLLEGRDLAPDGLIAIASNTPGHACPSPLTATRSALAYFDFASKLQRDNPVMGRLGVKHLLAAILYSDVPTSAQHRAELEDKFGVNLTSVSAAFLRRLAAELPGAVAPLTRAHASIYGEGSVPETVQGM